VLTTLTLGGIQGMEFLGSLIHLFCKQADSNPGPPGHKWRDSTIAPGLPFINFFKRIFDGKGVSNNVIMNFYAEIAFLVKRVIC